MAIQIDYFSANSDVDAASTADLESGVRAEPVEDDVVPVIEPTSVVPSQDVDPGLALGYLNALLTGVPVEEFVSGDWPALIATSTDEQKFVLQVDPGLIALLSTREGPFDELAQQWADVTAPEDAPEWNVRARDLAEFLTGFVELARRATDEGQAVYCWLWP